MTALDALSIRVDPNDAIRDIGRIRRELQELKREARETQQLLNSGFNVNGGVRGGFGPGGGGGFGGGGFGPGLAFVGGAAVDRFGPGFRPQGFNVTNSSVFDGGGSGSPAGPRGRFDPGLGRSGAIVPAVGRGLGVRGLAAGGLAFGGALAIRSATQDFIRFEDAQARLIAISGRTRSELTSLFDAVERGALQTRFSVTEASGAAETLLRAGLNPEQVSGAVNPTLRFAQATGTPIPQSARAASVASNIFGLPADRLPGAFNQLAFADSAADTTAAELAVGLSFGGGNARNAGLDLAESLTLLDLFAGSGARGSRGGTALRAFSDAFGNQLRGLDGDATALLRQFRDQGVGSDDLRALGLRATAISPVLGAINRLDEAERIEAGIRGAPGADVVGRRFDVTDDTLGADLAKLDAAFENTTNKLFENSIALDALRGASQFLTDRFNQISGSTDPEPRNGTFSQRINDAVGVGSTPAVTNEVGAATNQIFQQFQRGQDEILRFAGTPSGIFDVLGRFRAGDSFEEIRAFASQGLAERERIGSQRRSEFFAPIGGFFRDGIVGASEFLGDAASNIDLREINRQFIQAPGRVQRFLGRQTARGAEIARQEELARFQRFRTAQGSLALNNTLSTGVRIAGAGRLEGQAIQLTSQLGLDSQDPALLSQTVDQLERIQDLDRLRGSIDSLSDGFQGFFNVLRQSGDVGQALNALIDSLSNAALQQFVFGQGAAFGPGGPLLDGLFSLASNLFSTPAPISFGGGAGASIGGGIAGGGLGGAVGGGSISGIQRGIQSAQVTVNQNFISGGRSEREASRARQGVRQAGGSSLSTLVTRR